MKLNVFELFFGDIISLKQTLPPPLFANVHFASSVTYAVCSMRAGDLAIRITSCLTSCDIFINFTDAVAVARKTQF
jgi:hypothetical protein